MSRNKKFRIKFGSSLKLKLEKELLEIPLTAPIPGFLIGVSADGSENDFFYGFYDKEELSDTGPFQIFDADGVEFLIPQEHVRDRLRNRTIDIHDGKLTIDEFE